MKTYLETIEEMVNRLMPGSSIEEIENSAAKNKTYGIKLNKKGNMQYMILFTKKGNRIEMIGAVYNKDGKFLKQFYPDMGSCTSVYLDEEYGDYFDRRSEEMIFEDGLNDILEEYHKLYN